MSAAADTVRRGPAAAHWLTAERARLYPMALGLAYAVFALVVVLHDLLAPQRAPLTGNDFRVFWAASELGLHGHGAAAYDIGQLFPVQHAVAPSLEHAEPWQHWFYPPPFLLAVLPLAVLPYYPSFLLFNAVGLCFYLWVLRTTVPLRGAAVVALGSPAVLFTVVNGQNALITAGIVGLGIALVDRRPRLAGVLIGLLSMKPHLALLVGLALVAGRYWRVLGWAAASALVLLAASLLLFGAQSAIAFLDQVRVAKSFAEQGLLPLAKMPTVFASARLLGLPVQAANLVHGAVALVCASAVAVMWARRAAPYLRNSALVLACLLISPHLFDYDLLWLTWPIGWLSVHAIANGWQRGERELLVLAWVAPLVGDGLGMLHLQVAPLILVALLAMLARRAWARRTEFPTPLPQSGECR